MAIEIALGRYEYVPQIFLQPHIKHISTIAGSLFRVRSDVRKLIKKVRFPYLKKIVSNKVFFFSKIIFLI